MSEEPKLIRCPFCGSKGVFPLNVVRSIVRSINRRFVVIESGVYCNTLNCGAAVFHRKTIHLSADTDYNEVERLSALARAELMPVAKKHWNTRTACT